MEVHRELGCGFLEAVYQEALREELSSRNIPFRAEVEIPIFYKGKRLKTGYRADFVCYESIIMELKAISKLSGIETAQVLNYLRAVIWNEACSSTSAPKALSNADSSHHRSQCRQTQQKSA